MKNLLLQSLATCILLALGRQACAQVVPNIQQSIDRQVEQVQNTAIERAVEQAQNQTLDRTLEQVQTQVVDRTVEQVQNQAVDRVVERTGAVVGDLTADRVAQQQVENIQNQAVQQVQNVVEQAQAQVAEQAQAQVERLGQAERAQAQVAELQSQAAEIPAQIVPGTAVDEDTVVDDAASNAVAAAVPDEAAADTTPQRQTVNNLDGTPAFVEITLEPGVRAVEFEWIMVVTPAQRAQLDDEAAELLDYLTDAEPFALTEGELLTFTVPPDLDANDAILDLVPDAMRDLIDRNHIYDTQDNDAGGGGAAPSDSLLSLPMPAVCSEPLSVGMIDSAVDAQHPVFAERAASLHNHSFVDAKLAQPAGHGTAVAGLLVGNDMNAQAAQLRPLLPKANIYVAAVFHEQEGVQQGATVMRILAALDWLVSQPDLNVINMSLAGPPNRLLAQAVTAVTAKGKVIVAAAGNEGPYGPARYPAAYAEAIGVTAVARDSVVFRFANQGEHIDYAALGVDVPTALQDGSVGPGSGTSLAAPVVSAFIACAMARDDDLVHALAALDRKARDLGAPGADAVYGRGLLHP